MAPLTSAEKMRRFRQKLKDSNEYEAYMVKHKLHEKMSQERKKDSASKLPKKLQMQLLKDQRNKVKKKVANWRQKKLVPQVDPSQSPAYKSSATLGKARARVNRALPLSPRKKRCVLKLVFESEFGQLVQSSTKHRTSAVAPETVEAVLKFYNQDDISRQAPGRKDVVIVRNSDGSKVRMQARHLTASLLETHALFKKDFPDMKIGKSKFIDLRPGHVLTSNKLPHNVCLCKRHEDFIIAVNSFHDSQSAFPLYNESFVTSFLCAEETESCWLSTCETCKGQLAAALEVGAQADAPANWFVWETGPNGRLEKVAKQGSLKDLATYIVKLYPDFLSHVHTKREQAKTYNTERDIAAIPNSNSCLLQIDFSENFTCISQDEIQSAHWQQNQVSLFTAALWYSGSLKPIVIASDNLVHSKDTVIPYIARLLEELPESVREISIWSDGPSSQFKNKYIAAALKLLQDKYSVIIKWNFFASAHGKGPVDGIGGSVKRFVWRRVQARRHVVYNAMQFVRAAEDSNVKVFEMTSEEMNNRNIILQVQETFETCSNVVGISKCHFMKNSNGLVTLPLSKYYTEGIVGEEDQYTIENLPDQPSSLPELDVAREVFVDEWYKVEYEGQLYPGIVTDVSSQGDYKVKVMTRIGRLWKWPDCVDEIFYKREHLIQKIAAPCIMNQREHYSFEDM